MREDTATLRHVIKFESSQKKGLDSLVALSKLNMALDSNRHAFYYYTTEYCYSSATFESNDATLQELKSTGDYRLIEKDHVVDSLAEFERNLKQVYREGDYYRVYFNGNLERLDDLLDITVLGDSNYFKNGKMTNNAFPSIRGLQKI